jgi:hypothetical protein
MLRDLIELGANECAYCGRIGQAWAHQAICRARQGIIEPIVLQDDHLTTERMNTQLLGVVNDLNLQKF